MKERLRTASVRKESCGYKSRMIVGSTNKISVE